MAGNLDCWGWLSGATSSDLDLRARDVELRNATGIVNSKLLNAQEIFSCWDLGGNRYGVGGYKSISDRQGQVVV